MDVTEAITYDVCQQIDFLVGTRFPLFWSLLEPVISVDGVDYILEAVTTYEELQRHFEYGCYQSAMGKDWALLQVSGNPYAPIAAEAGWMAMQDIQFREGQVLPGDNQYE